MKVCSSAYWPLKQAWLALSVKTIQVEPAGNSQRSLRQLLKPGVLLHRVVNLEHEAVVRGPIDDRQAQPGGGPHGEFFAGVQRPRLPVQADPIRELAGQLLEVVGGDPDPRPLRVDVGEDPQQPVAVRRPGRERVEMQEVVPRMKRNLAPGFLDRPEAGEVDLPARRVPLQKGRHERDGPLRVAAHDLVDSRPLRSSSWSTPFSRSSIGR